MGSMVSVGFETGSWVPDHERQKLSLTFPSSPAVPPQFVLGVVWSERAPSLSPSIPGATVVSAPTISERERTAVSLRRSFFAFTWQFVKKRKNHNPNSTRHQRLHEKLFQTWNPVDIICPGSSFAIPTSVWSAILCVGSVSMRSGKTLAAMLDTKHSIASLDGFHQAFLDGITSPLVVSSKKAAFTLKYRDCSTSCVFKTAKSLD